MLFSSVNLFDEYSRHVHYQIGFVGLGKIVFPENDFAKGHICDCNTRAFNCWVRSTYLWFLQNRSTERSTTEQFYKTSYYRTIYSITSRIVFSIGNQLQNT